MLDDTTGEPLTRRLDDVEATLRRRLRGYEEQFSGVTSHYAATRVVTAVDANQDPTHVRSCVEAAIEGRAQPASVPFEMPGTRVGVAEGGADTAVVDGPAAVDTRTASVDGVDAARRRRGQAQAASARQCLRDDVRRGAQREEDERSCDHTELARFTRR